MMTTGNDILKRLSEPFPDEAIERTSGAVTGRGYDTTGIKYQFVVNRLNEALGLDGWRTSQEFTLREGQTKRGAPMFDVTCEISIVITLPPVDGAPNTTRQAERVATGGHRSMSEADARKGAYTNGLKKAAAMFGCGWQAYAGAIDDDAAPLPEVAPAAPPAAARREPAARTDATDPTVHVLGLIAHAIDHETLTAAGAEAQKLDAAGQAKARPAWLAKRAELRSQGGY